MYIECRERSIIQALGLSYLQSVRFKLENNQTLVVAGCFSGSGEDTGWIISGGDDLPYPDPKFKTDAEEADMQIWRHATDTSLSRVLIYSPDTDVYNIGLALTKPTSEFIVQINVPHT